MRFGGCKEKITKLKLGPSLKETALLYNAVVIDKDCFVAPLARVSSQ
jgi:hypothetical protein